MKKLLIVLFAFGTLSIILLESCTTSNKTSASKMLRFNLEKGKGYDYDMVWDMETKAGGQLSNIMIDCKYSMNIIEDDGKVKSVSTSYKSMKMDMSVMGMNMSFDSEKPVTGNDNDDVTKNPLGMMNKIVRGITGKSFIIKVNDAGDVLEVSGFEAILTNIVDSMGVTGDMKDQILASMKDQFSDQSIKDNFAMVFTIFPDKEVKVGDSWEKEYKTGGKMGASMRTTYTVKDIEGDHVTLETATKILPGESGTNISGTQTGNLLVDSKSGLMISGTFDQDMNVKAEGTTVEIKSKGKIKGTAN